MINEIDIHIKKNSKIISLQYGVGEIIGNFKLFDGIDDYLEVEYVIDSKIRYFCIKHKSDVRLISSRKSIDDALSLMSKRLKDHSIKNDYNESGTRFLDKNVAFIVKRIVELFRNSQRTVKDNILLHSTINSLVYEIEEVYSVNHKCARGIVSDYLKCA